MTPGALMGKRNLFAELDAEYSRRLMLGHAGAGIVPRRIFGTCPSLTP